MLDITKMLHQIIDLELAIDDAKELLLGPDVRKQTIFVDLDLALANTAETVGWFRVIKPQPTNQKQLVNDYAKVVALFLLFSAKMQWTHLVVLDDQTWKRIVNAQATTKLSDLNKTYLAVKHLLNEAYFNHQQESFRHAWHLLLKLGLVDWHLTAEEIAMAYQAMIDQAKKSL